MAHANLQYVSYNQLVKSFLQLSLFAKEYFQHFQDMLYSKNY